MSVRRRVGGYIFREELARACRGAERIRDLVRDLNSLAKKRADISAITTLLVEILLSTDEMESALREIRRIAEGEKESAPVSG